MTRPAILLPLVFVLPHALVFWPVVVWVSLPEARLLRQTKRARAHEAEQDAGTTKLIVYGTYAVLLAAIVASLVFPQATFSRHQTAWLLAGVALLAAGGLLRRHCFRMLGSHFTYAVRVALDQPVVERGVYRIVRHPSYAAGMLMYAGWGLALTNWISLALLVIVPALFYAKRIAVEERALVAMLGDDYAAYMRRTKKLVPYIY